MMEYMKDLKWYNTCLVGKRNWPANKLVMFAKKYTDKAGEGISLAAPKNGAIVQPSRSIGELYDLYHDRDDKILYLKVLTADIFG